MTLGQLLYLCEPQCCHLQNSVCHIVSQDYMRCCRRCPLSVFLRSARKSACGVSGGHVKTAQCFPTGLRWCRPWVRGLSAACWTTDTLCPPCSSFSPPPPSLGIALPCCPGYVVDILRPLCIVDLSSLVKAYWTRSGALTYTGSSGFLSRVLTCNLGRSGQTSSTRWSK